MPTDLPITVVLPEIIRHTPPWAWAILTVLVALGVRQMREQVVSRTRLTVAPLVLSAYSLHGAASAFGWRAPVLIAWAAGMTGAVVANRALRWPRDVRPAPGGGFVLGGSAWPLVLLVAVFLLRYVAGAAHALHPASSSAPVFALPMALGYGLLSGLFLARALRVLGTARPGSMPAPAPAGLG